MITSLEQLEARLGVDWLHLRRARELADVKRSELRQALAHLDSADTSIVVSGSLARDEFTEGSDIDWTLLIDGQSDPGHYALTKKIDERVWPIAGKGVGQEARLERWSLATTSCIRLAAKTTRIETLLAVYYSCSNLMLSVVEMRTETSCETY